MTNIKDFKIGDTVRYVEPNFNGWYGQEGTVTHLDHGNDHVYYRVTKGAPGHEDKHFNRIGRETYIMPFRLEIIKPVQPESPFKVGDTVYLTEKGRKKSGLPALKKRLKAKVTRVQWYRASLCYGYYLEIPGVTDCESLNWVDTYEFYEEEFEAKKNLKKASVERLKAEKIGTVVTDCEDDKWVYLGEDTWVHLLGEQDTVDLDTEGLVEEYGPISLI